jgi:hypothetical protein
LEKTSFPNNIPVPENVVGSLENPEDPEVPHDLLQTQRLHEPVPTQHLLTQQNINNEGYTYNMSDLERSGLEGSEKRKVRGTKGPAMKGPEERSGYIRCGFFFPKIV